MKKIEIPVRNALSINDKCARYTGFKPEKNFIKKVDIILKKYMPLPCDVFLERDIAITLSDGITIYTDIFRPNDSLEHPAIMTMSPYEKEIGSQWLDDTSNHA